MWRQRKGIERNPVIGDVAISTDMVRVIIDAKSGIGPRRALVWVVVLGVRVKEVMVWWGALVRAL